MQREEVKSILNEIFIKVFGKKEALKITDQSAAKDVNGWDSLGHMTLLSAIEDKFGITMSFAEIMSFNKVGDIVDYLINKTV